MFPKNWTRNIYNNIKVLNNILKYYDRFTIWHKLCSNNLKNLEKEVKAIAKEKIRIRRRLVRLSEQIILLNK
jgi:threonyl-tRNA synthetase